MADGILAAVNENGNIDRFIDTKGGVHYIEPKRYEESVAKIDAAATKAKETVNSATEAVSECKAQTGACTQETARAKEIADTVESRITGIEGDVAALRDSVSHTVLYKNAKGTTTNFVLSESVTDFEYIDIYYKSGVVRMYPADYVTVVLSANAFNKDGSLDVEGAYLSFSGKAATFTNANHKLFYKSNGYATFDNYSEVHQHLAVVLVLGYK